MTETEALQVALNARALFQVPNTFITHEAEQRIIELVENGEPVQDKLPGPGPTKDIVAWVVRLNHEGSFAEFAVDDSNGQVVRFRRSR